MSKTFPGCASRAFAALLFVTAIPCQSQPSLPSDSTARVQRVANGVYVILHDDAIHDWPSGVADWPHSNTGVIVGDDAVLVIDATFFPARARGDIALIHRLTKKPVRYLVNTHWHGDHTHGNAEYKSAFPGLRIVSARANGPLIARNQERFGARSREPNATYKQALKTLEQTLERGATDSGRVLTAEERAGLRAAIAETRHAADELASIRVAPPDLLFDDRLTLSLGRKRVELRNWGHANSPHDVSVLVPDSRVFFAGDMLVWPVPYAFESYPVPWISALTSIASSKPAAIVPGHGPVFRDMNYLMQVRELLTSTTSQAAALLVTGITLDSAKKIISVDAFRRRFVQDGDTNAAEYWRQSIQTSLVERSWYCVQGVRC